MILVIDYGMGNLGSVKRALEECGATEVIISHYESDFDRCTHAVLPGVGSFRDAMKNLHAQNLVSRIRKLTMEEKVPFLGICLGMQLLATRGEEHGLTEGLDLIPGTVRMLNPLMDERIPHVGWNEIHIVQNTPIIENIPDNSDFYFVHSFHFEVDKQENITATTPYCGAFTSVVANQNIMGTQFHPEKSSFAGFQVLKNFLAL